MGIKLRLLITSLAIILAVFVTVKLAVPLGHKFPIVIINHNDVELTNVPLRVVITATTFPYITELHCTNEGYNATGCNFWIVNSEEKPLYYWIEYFNSTEKKLVVWILVDKLPPKSTTIIYLEWGDTNPYTQYISSKNFIELGKFIFKTTKITKDIYSVSGLWNFILNEMYDEFNGYFPYGKELTDTKGYHNRGFGGSATYVFYLEHFVFYVPKETKVKICYCPDNGYFTYIEVDFNSFYFTSRDVWWAYRLSNCINFTLTLSPGWHIFVFFGGEPCCDGGRTIYIDYNGTLVSLAGVTQFGFKYGILSMFNTSYTVTQVSRLYYYLHRIEILPGGYIVSLPQWSIWKSSTAGPYITWGVGIVPVPESGLSISRTWLVDEYGGGSQPKSAYLLEAKSSLTYAIYGYAVNVTALAVNSTAVILDLYRNITAIFSKISTGLIPEPHATWLKSNMTVVYLKLDYLGDKVPIAIKYSLDDGVTWNDITASRAARIVDVDDPSNTTPAWFFDPTTNILAIRIPLNKTTGRAILEVKLGHVSVSGTVQPDKTDIYIGDIVNVKVTVTSKNVTYPVQVTIICVPSSEAPRPRTLWWYKPTVGYLYKSTNYVALNKTLLLSTTETLKVEVYADPGSYTCYVWLSKIPITQFSISVRGYVDKLYWDVPSGEVYLTPNDAIFFHLVDFYFTGKSSYSNVTINWETPLRLIPGEQGNSTLTYLIYSVQVNPITEGVYAKWNYWGVRPILSGIFNTHGRSSFWAVGFWYTYVPTENKYYAYGLGYGFSYGVGDLDLLRVYYYKFVFGYGATVRVYKYDDGFRFVCGIDVYHSTYALATTGSTYAKSLVYSADHCVGTVYLNPCGFVATSSFIGGWYMWRGVAFVGTIGSVVLLRGSFTAPQLLAMAKYHVVPWNKIIMLLDPTLFRRSDRTVPIVSARGYSGYGVVGSDVKVLLTTRFFVYVFKGFAHDGLPHILIPPGICIRIWNETFSYTYCNPGTYPWIDAADIMPLSPGRYKWALGEADVVDLAFLPRSLLYTGGQAVQIKTVPSLLYPSAPVRTPSNMTVYGGGQGLEITQVTHSFATSLLIETPIYDLSNVKTLNLQFTFKLTPYIKPQSNMIPIVIVERSGQDLSNYPVKIVLNSSNFHAWDALTCDRVWNPDTCNFWFTDSEGNPLYYWVEYFNKTVPLAIIWVKVPKIPAKGITVIEMQWGTTNLATAYLDPDNVFIFFDTVKTFTGWYQYGSGVLKEETTTVRDYPTYAILKDLYCDPNGGYKLLGTTVTVTKKLGVAIEAWTYRSELPGCDCNVFGLEDAKFSGYDLAICYSGTLYIDVRTNGYGSLQGQVTNLQYSTKTWLLGKLMIFSDKVIAELYKWDPAKGWVTFVGKTEISNTKGYTSFDRVAIHGGYPYIVDMIIVRPVADPEPAVYVNRSFAEFDLGFTSSSTVSSSSPRLVVVGRVGVENATYVVYGGSWSSPVVSGGGLVGQPVTVNVTWVSPSSVGDVTVRFTVGAYTYTWSGSYTMSGGLYLWIGFGSGLAYANVSVSNITLTYTDTQNNTYSYKLTFSSSNLASWSSGGGHVITLHAVFFPYSILVAFMANTTDYTIAEAISQSTLSSVTRISLASWGLAYYGVDRGVWVFASEKLFPVTPGLIYLKEVFPLAGYVEGSCLVVNVPSSSVRNAVLLMAYVSGAVTLHVDGSASSGGSVEAYYMVPGTIRRVEKFGLGRDVFIDYYVSPTPLLVYVRWRSAQVSKVELCATGQLTPLSLPLRIGFNSTLIAYVPAVLAVFNLTSNSIVDAGRVKNLVVELRNPSTASVLGTYKLSDINLIISPAPSLVLFTFNGTLFLDLSVLSGETIDAIPASLNPVAPIKLYVTVDRAHYESWRQPLYILLLYDTGVAKVAISSAYVFGAVTGSGDLIYYGFTLDVPQYLLGDYGELLVESVPTGLVEVFSPFRILDNQYVTVTKTLAGIEQVWRLPLSTRGIGQPPPAPSLPSQVIQQIFTPKPILLPRSPVEQAIVTVTLVVGVMVLAIVRRIDLVKAMMLAGTILLVVGVPLMVYGLYIPAVVGIVLIGTAIGLQKART